MGVRLRPAASGLSKVNLSYESCSTQKIKALMACWCTAAHEGSRVVGFGR